jgi:Oxidoreductase molybdopterin binding domain
MLLIAALAAASPPFAWAGQPATNRPSATLRVTGKVEHVLVLHETDLKVLPRRQLTISDDRGMPVTYEGVPVIEILQRAGAPTGNRLRGAEMKLYLVADASDGYRVVFALPEFDPGFTNQVILLADRRNGHPLSAPEGPFRIVVPDEKRHARWVREVIRLDIQQAR